MIACGQRDRTLSRGVRLLAADALGRWADDERGEPRSRTRRVTLKVYDYKRDGALLSFEVRNVVIGRRGAWRIARGIPGARMITTPPVPVVGWFGRDDFCRFTIDSTEIVIEEPWGDNSRYLIRASPPRPVPELLIVREAFLRAKPWRYALPF